MPDQPQAPSYQDVANSGAPDIQGSNLSQALNSPEPQPTSAPAPPDLSTVMQGQQPQAPPSDLTQAPAPVLPRFQRTVGSTLKGMLLGLAMDGVPGAIAGAATPTGVQRAADQQQSEAQARVKFANAQAASMVAEAAMNDAKLHALPQELQDQHNAVSLGFIKDLQDLGITPTLQAPNTGADASGALEQLTSSHGAVPPLFTVNVGHTVLAYDLSQLSGTPKGLDLVNRVRSIQGQSPIDPVIWRQTPVGARTELMNNTMQFFNPAPPKTAGDAFSQYQQYKNYADTYAKRKDVPNSGYDPAEADRLKTLVGNLKTISDNFDVHEKSLKADEASQNATATQNAKLAGDKTWYHQQIGENGKDLVGWAPPKNTSMSEQQFNSTKDKFNDKVLIKSDDTEKSYQMFQDTYNERKTAKSGAPSMLALSQHLATTFGNVKGSRVTKDMIHEHLGARSVSDAALTAMQKFTNGDVLSENQWNDFRTLISDSRTQTWNNTVRLAHAYGLPVTNDWYPSDLVNGASGSTNRSSNSTSSSTGSTNGSGSKNGLSPAAQALLQKHGVR